MPTPRDLAAFLARKNEEPWRAAERRRLQRNAASSAKLTHSGGRRDEPVNPVTMLPRSSWWGQCGPTETFETPPIKVVSGGLPGSSRRH